MRRTVCAHCFTPQMPTIFHEWPQVRYKSGARNSMQVYVVGRKPITWTNQCCLVGPALAGSWRQDVDPGSKPMFIGVTNVLTIIFTTRYNTYTNKLLLFNFSQTFWNNPMGFYMHMSFMWHIYLNAFEYVWMHCILIMFILIIYVNLWIWSAKFKTSGIVKIVCSSNFENFLSSYLSQPTLYFLIY